MKGASRKVDVKRRSRGAEGLSDQQPSEDMRALRRLGRYEPVPARPVAVAANGQSFHQRCRCPLHTFMLARSMGGRGLSRLREGVRSGSARLAAVPAIRIRAGKAEGTTIETATFRVGQAFERYLARRSE